MANKKTQTEIIDEFKIAHNNLYDYSRVDYKNMHTPVIIVCKKHGEFSQQPRAHKSGQGCSKCTISENWVPKRDTASFINQAQKVHGTKYDYSKTKYNKTMAKINVHCPTHGEFTQLANSHLNGRGCPKCTNNRLKSTKQFVKEAKKKHGELYDYSFVEYKCANNKITIVCRKHGAFKQKPTFHLTGGGCPSCGVESMKLKLAKSTKLFIAECSFIHNNKYDYSKTLYNNRTSTITIICLEHGEFKQKASEHLRGYGCPKCAGNQPLTTKRFIEKAKLVHNNRYCYSDSLYTRSKNNISIDCKQHGKFTITAGYHLQGGGCPNCSLSTQQHQILEFVQTLTNNVRVNDRTTIAPFELDILMPDEKFAIEFNGNFFHSYNNLECEDRYKHKNKTDLSINAGIRLIQISSHDWEHHSDLVKSMIAHRLGQSKRIFARKCSISKISNKVAYNFFNRNHISNHRAARKNYGLFHNGELMSAINFSPIKDGGWEIIRYASRANTTIVGGLGKLLSAFVKDTTPQTIVTFTDRRYGNGNGYLKTGFRQIAITRPGYIYLDSNSKPAGSRIKFQKHKLSTILDSFDPSLTEAENMFNNGYRRLWDAGHIKLQKMF